MGCTLWIGWIVIGLGAGIGTEAILLTGGRATFLTIGRWITTGGGGGN